MTSGFHEPDVRAQREEGQIANGEVNLGHKHSHTEHCQLVGDCPLSSPCNLGAVCHESAHLGVPTWK